MQEHTFHFKMNPIPHVMRRGKHVLLLLVNSEGKFILGSKKRYPKGIVRFAGGGVDQGEDLAKAAVRELEEEVGLVVKPNDLTPVAHIEAQIDCDSKMTQFDTYLYYYNVGNAKIVPNDDLDALAYFSADEMRTLVKNFSTLSTEVQNFDGEIRWSDYGLLYGPIHMIGLQYVEKLQLAHA